MLSQISLPIISSLALLIFTIASSVTATNFNVSLLGANNIGKATLAFTMAASPWRHNSHMRRRYTVIQSHVNLHDRPGTKILLTFRVADEVIDSNLLNLQLRSSHVIVLVYDVTNQATLKKAMALAHRAFQVTKQAPYHIPILLCGNKIDEYVDSVHGPIIEMAELFCKQQDLEHFLISAQYLPEGVNAITKAWIRMLIEIHGVVDYQPQVSHHHHHENNVNRHESHREDRHENFYEGHHHENHHHESHPHGNHHNESYPRENHHREGHHHESHHPGSHPHEDHHYESHPHEEHHHESYHHESHHHKSHPHDNHHYNRRRHVSSS